ncbi:hypothetical protein [Streptococcus equi]|uniref:hypothetical protein n=1 Tax=Streptococcus equi TaxID=1336 RepID=UPI0039C6B83C
MTEASRKSISRFGYTFIKVYPNLDIDFLDASVIDKAKKMAVFRNKNHVWENMSNEELLRSANLILTDPETKREGITLAAILLFGKDNSIMSVLPHTKLMLYSGLKIRIDMMIEMLS